MTSLTIESECLRKIVRREFSAFTELQNESARSGVDMTFFGKLAVTLFERLVRERFTSDTSLYEITSFCVHVRDTFRKHLPIPAIAVEMIIRYELGEEVPIADLANEQQLAAMMLVACLLVHSRAMVDSELDALLAEVERSVVAE